ncbi:response regulator transcription factor [Enterobacteriaceae bacterium H11S18]|uniref:response regulator transcription factor n=1 Tax=Dryocola clanedunensis TaxID=2925396 RepID=UPI0022F0B76B|nr:response regulator transcription factor [Dryocola clanedunensis]MCT4707891.1 response regulator transcription factor [Dryocola clanedunensis]MCT4711284.1 response regulator transcription factor [Dryocola clanedunensis]
MASVLLVDDHPAICFALKVTLEKKGDLHVTTSNGERLIQQIHRDAPDLLLLDLELDGQDGLDLLPRLKQHFPSLSILIYTNQPAALYARRTVQAGADGFVNKSLNLDALESVCRLLLEGYHCFPQEAMELLRNDRPAPQSSQTLLSRLSDRELTVLHSLMRGQTNKQIGDSLSLSNKTISTYKVRIMKKCGVDSLEPLFKLLNEEVES